MHPNPVNKNIKNLLKPTRHFLPPKVTIHAQEMNPKMPLFQLPNDSTIITQLRV